MTRYQFALIVESKLDKGYVTQPLWLALKVGTVHIYIGAPDTKNYLPHPDAAIVVCGFASVGHLIHYLQEVSSNVTLYERHLAWRGHTLSPGFMYTVHTSVSTLVCAVCDEVHVRNQYTGCM
jgi:hypothetical protein